MNRACPLPLRQYPRVVMGHGGGGRLMKRLIEDLFMTAFGTSAKEAHDATVLPGTEGERLAMTTDSYVIHPLFFPGGNIGTLAVYGTVNDLAMAGARPLWLSVGFILEEGLDITTLWDIAVSMNEAADRAGIKIVTGDTKVVEKGKGDGIFINTAGIGTVPEGREVHPRAIQPCDAIVLSGDLGRHGMTVMARREQLAFDQELRSDCAPLAAMIDRLFREGIPVHCLRDLTRGGLAGALNELAEASGRQIQVQEAAIPVSSAVRSACELLGLDPFYVANEGRCVIFVPATEAERTVQVLRTTEEGRDACVIGSVEDRTLSVVVLKTALGSSRLLDMPETEQLPRIC